MEKKTDTIYAYCVSSSLCGVMRSVPFTEKARLAKSIVDFIEHGDEEGLVWQT